MRHYRHRKAGDVSRPAFEELSKPDSPFHCHVHARSACRQSTAAVSLEPWRRYHTERWERESGGISGQRRNTKQRSRERQPSRKSGSRGPWTRPGRILRSPCELVAPLPWRCQGWGTYITVTCMHTCVYMPARACTRMYLRTCLPQSALRKFRRRRYVHPSIHPSIHRFAQPLSTISILKLRDGKLQQRSKSVFRFLFARLA